MSASLKIGKPKQLLPRHQFAVALDSPTGPRIYLAGAEFDRRAGTLRLSTAFVVPDEHNTGQRLRPRLHTSDGLRPWQKTLDLYVVILSRAGKALAHVRVESELTESDFGPLDHASDRPWLDVCVLRDCTFHDLEWLDSAQTDDDGMPIPMSIEESVGRLTPGMQTHVPTFLGIGLAIECVEFTGTRATYRCTSMLEGDPADLVNCVEVDDEGERVPGFHAAQIDVATFTIPHTVTEGDPPEKAGATLLAMFAEQLTYEIWNLAKKGAEAVRDEHLAADTGSGAQDT